MVSAGVFSIGAGPGTGARGVVTAGALGAVVDAAATGNAAGIVEALGGLYFVSMSDLLF